MNDDAVLRENLEEKLNDGGIRLARYRVIF